MIDLGTINVNLLVALDALLSERNVTQAGKKIGIAQSSMSHALSSLREIFDDPLLVRSPEGMIPTTRGEQLEAPLREALEQLRKAIEIPGEFEPATASARFSVASDEIQQVILLPRLLQILHERAPGILLHTEPPSDAETSYQRLRIGELDFALGRFDNPPAGIHREMLSTDRVIFLARRGHPRIKKTLSKEQLKKEPQLLPTPITGGKLPSSLMSLLERRRSGPYFIATTPHLLASLFIVSQTDIITATVERVAKMYKEALGLVILSPPITLPAADTHIVWHERTHHSSAHRWLLELLMELARD
ncbi:MAG: LysR family transcriptional regulator [Deltaproteobacteria bacterium]|nr:LysR family transcriptional regulator [Deltaproteobacteria bacterium]